MNKIIPTHLRAIAALLSLFLLFGCGESGNTPKVAAGPAVSRAAAFDTVAQKGAGFTVGNMMATRTLYVFFDAQCPHCATLWNEAKPLAQQARLVWMPVQLLNNLSGPQGAALLSAANSATLMDSHEKQRNSGGKGIEPPADLAKEQLAKVAANTALMTSLGVSAVPTLVYKNAVTGAPEIFEGAMQTAELRKILGL